MKRFYGEVTVDEADGGFRVMLDGRAILTQGQADARGGSGAAQIVPTRALAEALAEEWRAQGETIDPRAFPLRDLADYALDQVASDQARIATDLLRYAETDTLCYRADPDQPLFARQHEEWEPLLVACEAAHGIVLERISGIIHRAQPAASLLALHRHLTRLDAFTLAGLATLARLAASLVAALAMLEPGADAERVFAAANLEEDWQAERWGADQEARQVRALRLEAFTLAARFIDLVRAPN